MGLGVSTSSLLGLLRACQVEEARQSFRIEARFIVAGPCPGVGCAVGYPKTPQESAGSCFFRHVIIPSTFESGALSLPSLTGLFMQADFREGVSDHSLVPFGGSRGLRV